MRIDLQSLETYNDLAQEGAEQAAASLTQMTNIQTHVNVTNVTLMAKDDISGELGGREFVGVQIGLDGVLSGKTVLGFDRESVRAIVDVLVPGNSEADDLGRMAKSGVEEVGNIMMSGFIDGWADYLGTSIDMTPPTYVERTGVNLLPEDVRERNDHIFVFKSQVQAVDKELNFFIYLVPDVDTLSAVMERQGGSKGAVQLDKLSIFNEMTTRGAANAASNISSMTGIETDVEVSRLRFTPVEEVPNHVATGEYVGTVFQLDGAPSGYLTILFDEPSAHTLIEALIGATSDGNGWNDMEESAIKEIGNIMTSGFIDGWANVLDSTIDHSPPQFVNDMGSAILDPIAGRLGQTQQYAFIIDSTVKTADREFNCDIYALPDERELRAALDGLDADSPDQMESDVDSVF